MQEPIVVDTSVIISALISSKGASRAVLRLCLSDVYKPLISNALFQEIEAVITRDQIKKRCPLYETGIRDLINTFYNRCRWVPMYYLWRPNLKDENDHFLIELAVAGNSSLIVTNNVKDFKHAELTFDGLTIIKPQQLNEVHANGNTHRPTPG